MGNLGTKRVKKISKQFINWFEIPVHDLNRAVSFYNYLYGIQLEKIEMNEYAMALFPGETSVGGALVMGPGSIPSETGTLVYLNATEDMDVMLQRVEKLGGRIIMEKTKINDETGYFALFIDSEGNKLALNSKV